MSGPVTDSPGPDEGSTPALVLLAFERFISSARWFGGKGRDFRVTAVEHLGWLPAPPGDGADEVWVRSELATIEYADAPSGAAQGQSSEVYQVPVAYYAKPQERLEHALIGQWEEPDLGPVCAYDALHDRNATGCWLRAFHDEHRDQRLSFHRVGDHVIDLDTHSTLFSGEQSNSSVAFGEDSLMKVFRRVTPGRNPDIEIHEVLTTVDTEHVAALYGWVEASPAPRAGVEGQPTQLAMLQQFLRTASDGWDLAVASVRDLFAEADLHADEVGGDFAAEAHRLGFATAQVHEALREHLPDATWHRDQLDALAAAMRQRLHAAVDVVPDLEPHARSLSAAYDALAGIDEPVLAQRVHGDLHLGQTLRTARGWKIVDFEGEPAKPLSERVEPDSAWRDVAGMLRSFDYAAHAVEKDVEQESEQIAYRAMEWAVRNRGAYLAGYLESGGSTGAGLTATQQLLLTAYEADKAVYETVYEARNRPGWLPIPLAAVARLTDPEEAPHL